MCDNLLIHVGNKIDVELLVTLPIQSSSFALLLLDGIEANWVHRMDLTIVINNCKLPKWRCRICEDAMICSQRIQCRILPMSNKQRILALEDSNKMPHKSNIPVSVNQLIICPKFLSREYSHKNGKEIKRS